MCLTLIPPNGKEAGVFTLLSVFDQWLFPGDINSWALQAATRVASLALRERLRWSHTRAAAGSWAVLYCSGKANGIWRGTGEGSFQKHLLYASNSPVSSTVTYV